MFELLKGVKTIALCAGHTAVQGRDMGANSNGFVEGIETIFLTERVATILRKGGLSVDIVPHELDLVGGIRYVNDFYRGRYDDVWAVELHRDSYGFPADTDMKEISNRLGCYFYTGDVNSEVIANNIRDIFKNVTNNPKCWSRQDIHTSVRPGGLGWIRQTAPVAHLLELGFMQGYNTPEHLENLAVYTAKVLFTTFTGNILPETAYIIATEIPSPVDPNAPKEETPEDQEAVNHFLENMDTLKEAGSVLTGTVAELGMITDKMVRKEITPEEAMKKMNEVMSKANTAGNEVVTIAKDGVTQVKSFWTKLVDQVKKLKSVSTVLAFIKYILMGLTAASLVPSGTVELLDQATMYFGITNNVLDAANNVLDPQFMSQVGSVFATLWLLAHGAYTYVKNRTINRYKAEAETRIEVK
jgi:hypothetical protein